jgi:transcriptional regulator with XRE-family HTH domain
MASATFGTVLKEWRGIRRMSQLDLSNAAEVSARHISFLESGRSKPSRPMALHLAEALELPRGERNRLLTAAGFSPMWHKQELDSEAMAPIHDAIRWTLDRHNPYPAVVLDRHWKVIDRNEAASAMFAGLGLPDDLDFLDAMTTPGGIRDLVDNWSSVGRYMHSRLRTESAAVGGDAVLDAAVEKLAADPELEPTDEPFPPIVTLDLRLGDAVLSMFSTIAQFGTAEDLALAEFRIELFFPGDEPTRQFLEALSSSPSPSSD